MATAEALRKRAVHYRRLADGILRESDPTRIRLLERAVEFERRAAATDAEEPTSAKPQPDAPSNKS